MALRIAFLDADEWFCSLLIIGVVDGVSCGNSNEECPIYPDSSFDSDTRLFGVSTRAFGVNDAGRASGSPVKDGGDADG